MTEIKHEIDANFAGRLNILRAGVLGANDGIISIAESLSVLPVRRAISGLSFYLDWPLSSLVLFLWPVANMSLYPLRKTRKKPLSLRATTLG